VLTFTHEILPNILFTDGEVKPRIVKIPVFTLTQGRLYSSQATTSEIALQLHRVKE
jgi:hypothetical protein